MLYFDTSFLVPLLMPEQTSNAVEAFFHGPAAGEALVVSQWTRLEFLSVLSRLVRMGEVEASAAAHCARRFDTVLAESFHIVTPGVPDYDRCRELLSRFDNSLRAGDALHLAIAANLAAPVLTLDKGMLQAGEALGLQVARGISA